MHMAIYDSCIRNCQNLEATNMAFSGWIGKEGVAPDHKVIFIHEKENLPFVTTGMEVESIMLRKIS